MTCEECGSDQTTSYPGIDGDGDVFYRVICDDCGNDILHERRCDRCDSREAGTYVAVLSEESPRGGWRRRRYKVQRCVECAARLPECWSKVVTDAGTR